MLSVRNCSMVVTGPLCFREEKGSTLAVAVATEAFSDTEATRRYIIYTSGSRGPYSGLERREQGAEGQRKSAALKRSPRLTLR